MVVNLLVLLPFVHDLGFDVVDAEAQYFLERVLALDLLRQHRSHRPVEAPLVLQFLFQAIDQNFAPLPFLSEWVAS